MIQITLTNAIFLYGAIIVLGAVLLYAFGELRAKRVYRVLEKQFMWRCAFCTFLYLDEEAQTLSQCPRCGSFNAAADAQDKAVRADKQRLQPAAVTPVDNDADAPRRNPSRRKRTRQSRRGPRRRR